MMIPGCSEQTIIWLKRWILCLLVAMGFFDPTPSEGQFKNPGVYSFTDQGVLYEWIPSENVSVEIKDERVKILAPMTKPSWNGKNQCRRFLFGDLYDNQLPPAEENALFGEGLALPPGNYAFRIVYANASGYNELKASLWNLMGIGSGTEDDNSAMMEVLYISVTAPGESDGQLNVPGDLYRASWLPHYQLLPYQLRLPSDKAFGITRYIAGLPKKDIFKKATHVQYVYSWLDREPYSRKWKNLQAYNHSGQLVQPPWLIRNSPLDKNFITLAEIAENYGNLEGDCPRCYDKAEEVFRGLYQRYQRELGVRSPAETRLYDDYFGALYGYGLEMNFNETVNNLRRGLSSQAMARNVLSQGRWQTSSYFSAGAYEYRNFRLGGYLGNLFNTLVEGGLYRNIYNLEKVNLAVPDRKLLKNGWQTAEAVGLDKVTDAGTFFRLKISGGDLLRLQPNTWPMHTMLAESFFQLLLGNDYILWNSNIPMSVNPEHFSVSFYGGADPWKTKWQEPGKSPVEYNPRKRSHPSGKQGVEGSVFPESPLQGETGAFIGAWIYSQISSVSDRVSRSLRYCDFSVNGKNYKPQSGQAGDASLSSRIRQNPGQDWIVSAFEQQAPICICSEGENGRAIIYQNPHGGLTARQLIEIPGFPAFNATGNRLHVFLID